MLARKGLFIILLIAILSSYFYLRPLFFKEPEEPLLEDRMPEGDYLGRMYLFDLAKETTDLLFYNQLPMRDLLTPDFLLAQAKSYGIDLQKPSYFFANENKEWGSLITLTDSAKIRSGIIRLKNNFEIKDTVVAEQKVFRLKEDNVYFTYGKTWLFIYHGANFPKRMYHVVYSKKGDIHPRWAQFLNEQVFSDEKLVVYANTKRWKTPGIAAAMFAHDADSVQMHFKTYVRTEDSLYVVEKDSGLAFPYSSASNKLLNVHLDVNRLRTKKDHPIYFWLNKLGKRIAFPVGTFMDAWDGDLAFHQGGTVSVQETYVESVFDEDFNVTEVKRTKEVKLPGFSFLMTTNHRQKELISKLFSKGIMRKERSNYYFLNSPPLKLIVKPAYLYFNASNQIPKLTQSNENIGVWNWKGNQLRFSLDSLSHNEVFGSIHAPAMGLLRNSGYWKKIMR